MSRGRADRAGVLKWGLRPMDLVSSWVFREPRRWQWLAGRAFPRQGATGPTRDAGRRERPLHLHGIAPPFDAHVGAATSSRRSSSPVSAGLARDAVGASRGGDRTRAGGSGDLGSDAAVPDRVADGGGDRQTSSSSLVSAGLPAAAARPRRRRRRRRKTWSSRARPAPRACARIASAGALGRRPRRRSAPRGCPRRPRGATAAASTGRTRARSRRPGGPGLAQRLGRARGPRRRRRQADDVVVVVVGRRVHAAAGEGQPAATTALMPGGVDAPETDFAARATGRAAAETGRNSRRSPIPSFGDGMTARAGRMTAKTVIRCRKPGGRLHRQWRRRHPCVRSGVVHLTKGKWPTPAVTPTSHPKPRGVSNAIDRDALRWHGLVRRGSPAETRLARWNLVDARTTSDGGTDGQAYA